MQFWTGRAVPPTLALPDAVKQWSMTTLRESFPMQRAGMTAVLEWAYASSSFSSALSAKLTSKKLTATCVAITTTVTTAAAARITATTT